MKKRLLALLAKKEEARKALVERAKTCEVVDELRSINSEVESLNNEITELRGMVDAMPADEGGEGAGGEQRGAQQPIGGFNPMGTFGIQQPQQRSEEAQELEYRKAFMNFVLKGESVPTELRATSLTTDITAVIPNTVMERIVEKMTTYGQIFARVTKTNIKGGVSIPTSSAKPTATWTAEGSVAAKQKKTVTGSITFSYFKLQCRVAVSLEASTTSLNVFEQTVVNNIYEAIIVALEQSIISGSGTNQPKGIINHAGVASLTMTAAQIVTYPKWIEAFSKLTIAYAGKGVLTMTKTDWDKYIVGMVDTTGQPIARTNMGVNGTLTYTFNGMPVVLVDDYLTSFDVATTTTTFAFIADYSDYMLNSNLQLSVKRYFDEETDEFVTKATLLADGKLVDTNGVVLIKKA